MSKRLNREVRFIDKEWNVGTTYFRWQTIRDILPYFEKFKDSIADVIYILKPKEED